MEVRSLLRRPSEPPLRPQRHPSTRGIAARLMSAHKLDPTHDPWGVPVYPGHGREQGYWSSHPNRVVARQSKGPTCSESWFPRTSREGSRPRRRFGSLSTRCRSPSLSVWVYAEDGGGGHPDVPDWRDETQHQDRLQNSWVLKIKRLIKFECPLDILTPFLEIISEVGLCDYPWKTV